jgi:hypothetical protein
MADAYNWELYAVVKFHYSQLNECMTIESLKLHTTGI